MLGLCLLVSVIVLNLTYDNRGQAQTSTMYPSACTVTVSGTVHTVALGDCGCTVPGYEISRCIGDNKWRQSRTYCETVCNPSTGITSCNDERLDFPETTCENKTVGDACGAIPGTQCEIITGYGKPYCDCVLNIGETSNSTETRATLTPSEVRER